jgi:hypothetical protein
MRNSALSGVAALTILSGGLLVESAVAMTGDAGSTSAVAATAVPLREAAVVCGSIGCYTPQTKHQLKRKLVPLGHG